MAKKSLKGLKKLVGSLSNADKSEIAKSMKNSSVVKMAGGGAMPKSGVVKLGMGGAPKAGVRKMMGGGKAGVKKKSGVKKFGRGGKTKK